MKPGWMSGCEKRALRAVTRLNDSSELTQAAIHSPQPNARIEAVRRLVEDDMLLEVLLESRDCGVHEAVVRGIRDTNKLIPYARSGLHIPARCLALKRITDQNTLQSLILSDPCGWVREAAMRNIIDQQFLADVALGIGDCDIPARVCAARHITQEPAARRVSEALAAGCFGGYADDFSDALSDGMSAESRTVHTG